jgi:hypothetical protein
MYWRMLIMTEVQDIFEMYGMEYLKKHKVSEDQYKAMIDIIECRTSKLGGHVDECEECGHIHIVYNSCCNRNCPKCQTLKKVKWIDARKEELLPVPYFHIVFTIPEELNMLAYQNQKIVYKILFDAVSGTLLELAADPKHLGAKIGFTSILHTWGQNLMYHPHSHCIAPSGGLTPDGNFKIGKDNFFIHVKVLSEKFRGKFLALLGEAYELGKLSFYGDMAEYNYDQFFQEYLNFLRRKEWVVYSKETFNGPEVVIEYLGRYTHRIAISNNRILSIDNGNVTFKWKDYRDGKQKIMTITAEEFIRRFLLHVLPSGFMKIRYYGILSNRNKSTELVKCRIAAKYTISKSEFKNMSTVDIIKTLTGKDITQCPCCKTGKMKTIRTIYASRGRGFPTAVA